MYVFIDESGDTGYSKKSTRYFILTAVIVEDIFTLRRIAKNVHKYKIDKKKNNILHAYDETNRVKNKLTREINNIDIGCIVFVLDKRDKFIVDPYMYLLKKIAVHFSESYNFYITLAKRDTRKSYNRNISRLFNSYSLNLVLSDPVSEKSLQIADFYSWVIFSYLENANSEYFLKLNSKIIFL